ncbi:hypothetical protein LguiA_002602 [Lonicera macranthoides]
MEAGDSKKFRTCYNYQQQIIEEKCASERQIVAKKLKAENTDRFARQVNRVLKLHKSPTIEEFRVCVELDENYKINIDEWLKFALTRRVQWLELYMAWHHIGPLPCSQRPSNLVLPSETISVSEFKSLKSLHLKAVDVSGQVLENILANCPVLERFAVHGSLELKTFKLASPSLVSKYLEISWCPNLNSIEICNLTNLVRFGYRGPDMNLRLNSVPRLVELSISGRQIQLSMPDFLPKFSSCFSQLETLELDVNQVVEFGGFRHVRPPEFPNLRKLVLKSTSIGDCDKCLLGYTSLIKASPLLQKFVLVESEGGGKWPHELLEEVELAGYYGNKSHQELVIYFLENATALKRIIVRPCDQSHDYMKLQLPITRDVIMTEKACDQSHDYMKLQLPITRDVIMMEKAARRRAKEHLRGIIPPGNESTTPTTITSGHTTTNTASENATKSSINAPETDKSKAKQLLS